MNAIDLPRDFRAFPRLDDERQLRAPVLSEQQEITDGKVAQLQPVVLP